MATQRSLLLLLSCTLACAETIPIRSYTVAQGLAHDHVNRIFRDSHDFLWVCTDEGLSRFDGHRFVNYTVADGLPHIHVNDIVEARTGDYFIATDGGLTLFRPADASRRFTTYKPNGPAEAAFVNSLRLEPDGAVLLGTAGGLYRLRRDDQAFQFENIDFGAPPGVVEGTSVSTMQLDLDGTLWLGGVSGLYHKDSNGTWTHFAKNEGLKHPYVSRIAIDPEGRLWVCTREGLGRIVRKPQPGRPVLDVLLTTREGLPSDDIRTILFTSDGRRWIGTLGGLVEWLPGTPSAANFRTYSVQHGLTDREIYEVVTGPDGNLWIGSRRGGLMCLSRTGFQTYGQADGIVLSGSDQIVETPSGAICIAAVTDPRRAIRCFDGKRFGVTLPRLPGEVNQTPPTATHSTLADHTGKWWISNDGLLLRFGAGPAGAPDLELLRNRQSRRLFEDSQGDIWITTLTAGAFGLMRWRRATAELEDRSSTLPTLLRERDSMSLAEIPNGQLWIGLARPGGLFRWRRDHFEEVAGAPRGTIQALYGDRSNRLWIASAEDGVGRIDEPAADHVSIRIYNRSAGLASSEIWCITEDEAGQIYFGTARGVDRLDPASGRITHFSTADGLAPGDIRAALRSRTGDLWFLSNHGLSRLRPASDVPQRPTDVRITGIRVAGAVYPISELGEPNVSAAEFAWNRSSIQIDFSAISFRAPEQVRYQFRLEGAADEWSEPSRDSTVHFSNLAPGSYRFLARVANSGGRPAAFAFTISPPPWQRWWFQAGVAVLILGIGYLAHRIRFERQLALERVRSRIATDLHDDIGASLSRIAVMSEAVKSRVSPADADSQRMLADMAENSRQIVDGMSDIVWSIDPRHDFLRDVVARLRAFGSDVLEPKGIRWTCEGPSDALDRHLSPDQRRELYLIFKEAIHNIARHSQSRNVSLRMSLENGHLCADIQDDGRGVGLESEGGLGIASMRARTERLRGTFRIEPRPEGGTRAAVQFPLGTKNA